MEIRQLRHFVALAEEMHFGRAAERSCISQPALSASIIRLEEDFGIRLFDRDSKFVRITPAGEMMLKYAREMLDNADRTKSFSRAIVAGRIGRLEIGFTQIVLMDRLHVPILQCRTELPDIEIVMREFTSQKQIELLHAGRLDAGIVSLSFRPTDLELVELFEDRFVVCLSPQHPLASRSTIDVAELRDERFVMIARQQAPTVYDQLISVCGGAGFHPQVCVESNSLSSLVGIVARGFGVALVPQSVSRLGLTGATFVLVERALPCRRGYFVWRASREAPGLQAVVSRVRAFASSAKLGSQGASGEGETRMASESGNSMTEVSEGRAVTFSSP